MFCLFVVIFVCLLVCSELYYVLFSGIDSNNNNYFMSSYLFFSLTMHAKHLYQQVCFFCTGGMVMIVFQCRLKHKRSSRYNDFAFECYLLACLGIDSVMNSYIYSILNIYF